MELKIKIKWFLPSMRIYDAFFGQIGIVCDVNMENDIIYVAFPKNISKHGGSLNYVYPYGYKHFIRNSRLMMVDENETIMTLEEYFKNQLP